jgi:tetratricopeptide (TPR) repeat protein
MRFVAVALAGLALIACNRDPNYLKQKYLESGNKYFGAKRYKEASIMYRKSIERDRKFGPAWYQLALTDLALGEVTNSVPALHRAVDLLKPGTPDADDASMKLAELLVLAANSQQNNDQLVQEVQQIRDGFLKRKPNAWEGHKLAGDLHMLNVSILIRQAKTADAKDEINSAVTEYRTALAAKGGNDPGMTLSLGHALEASGDVVGAEAMFRKLVEESKTNIQGYVELYRIYLAQKKMDQAEAVLKEAIQNNPKDASSRFQLGRFYLATGKRDQLLGLLNEMKGNLKDFPEAYIQAGDFYLRTGVYDEAIRQYEEGIAKDPKQRDAYLKHEIEAYVAQGKPTVANDKNEQILKDNPKDNDARQLQAAFMLDKGSVDQAMQELQSVVTASPSNFLAHFNLGRAHFARAEYDLARQEFEKAIQLRPDYIPARLGATQIDMIRGDNEQALRSAEDLIRIAPGNGQARIMEASALQRLGRMSEARTILERILQVQPNRPEALLEMGVLDLNEKKYKDAEQVFAKAYAAQPANLRGLLGESAALRMQSQPDKSIQIIAQEFARNPTRVDLQRELGNAQADAGQYDVAIQTFNNVLPKVTDARARGDIFTRIGQAYRMKHDSQHSIEAFESATKELPNNPAILTNLAELYSEQANYGKSRQYYESALKVEPNNPVALNNLAYLLADTNGDLDLALTYATRARQRLPDHLEISDTLGWIYLKKNLTDSALDTFRRLVSQSPDNATYHYHYAIALSKKGDRDTARRECQTALSDKPSGKQEEEIRRFLQQLT